ncbi:hypothetical protein OAU50_05280, partial [Planctomycetota bacterium]|nr:hypothetical protein [Planctomycetota bacterium]
GGYGGRGGSGMGGPGGGGVKKAAVPGQDPRGGGGAREADPAQMPSWQSSHSSVIESATEKSRPIVIYFAGEKDNEFTVYGEGLRELSMKSAVFIKFEYNPDREDAPDEDEATSIVPTNPLLSRNPAKAYDVRIKAEGTLVVCDWYGNKHYDTKASSKVKAITALVEKVADQVEKDEKSLRKNFEKAQAAVKKEDRKNAIKSLLKNFKDGKVGLAAQEESITLYHKIMDTARDDMADLSEAKDVEGLKKLAGDLKKTDVEDEIKAAIKDLG